MLSASEHASELVAFLHQVLNTLVRMPRVWTPLCLVRTHRKRSRVIVLARGVFAGGAIIVRVSTTTGFFGSQVAQCRPLPRLALAALRDRSLGIDIRHCRPPKLQISVQL